MCRSLDFINHHNANLAEELGYTVAVNQFADLTLNEFSRQFLGFNKLQKPKFEPAPVLDAAAAPDAVDWTTKGAVTPVKVL